MIEHTSKAKFDRRSFVVGSTLFLTTSGFASKNLLANEDKPKVRFGLVTDLHYADKNSAGSRHYRETLAKLQEAAVQFEKDQPDHIVELGDLIDAADSVETEKGYLRSINKVFAELPGKKHYVLGNHCVHTLTKKEFLEGVSQKRSYYSFESGGFHFVILDACFRGDGQPYGRKNFNWTDPNVSVDQVAWLEDDLKRSTKKTIVFIHQRLDVANNYGVKNAAAIRSILEKSGKVLAVFQGHSHKNEVKEINGIHYCVHRAMVEGSGKENNGYSTMDVFQDGTIRVKGYREQKNYDWT